MVLFCCIKKNVQKPISIKYIKTEIFPRTLGKRISRVELVQHASDYDDFYLAFKEETLKRIETAEELLMTFKEYCRSRNYGSE